MKLAIFAANGLMGRHLCQHFISKGDEVFAFTRQAFPYLQSERFHNLLWDAKNFGDWQGSLEGCDIVINLCGRSVNCRYNTKNKQEIYDSRSKTTTLIGEAIKVLKKKPSLWFNAATATIYREEEEQKMNEIDGIIGQGFSVDVAQKWEDSFFQFKDPEIRQIALRSSIILANGGDFIDITKKLAGFGLAGTQGSGEQYISWLHIHDFCRAIDWMIEHQELKGPINLVSPDVLKNKDFMRLFRQQLKSPFGFPSPSWLIKLGAIFLRTESELVLKSRYIEGKVLADSGFQFQYAKAEEALESLLQNCQ